MTAKYCTLCLLTAACAILPAQGLLGQSVTPAPSDVPGAADAPTRIDAITKPCDERKQGFIHAGIVGKILVKLGQDVKEGDILAQQDDQAELVQLAQLKADADDDTRVRAAKAQLEQKQVDLKKLQKALAKGASTELEVQHADLDVKIAVLQQALEEFNRSQAALKAKELEVQIYERMRIKSKINGRVEELLVQEGESCDALAKVIRVVNIDKLWIDVSVPMSQASKFPKGGTAQVRFDTVKGLDTQTAKGSVIFVAAVADAASDTRMVRVEVDNPGHRPAGEHVSVLIPENSSAAVAENTKAGSPGLSSK